MVRRKAKTTPRRERKPTQGPVASGRSARPTAPALDADAANSLRRIVVGLVMFVLASALVAVLLVWGAPVIADLVDMLLGKSADPVAFDIYFNAILFGVLMALATVGGAITGLNPFAPGRHRPLILFAFSLFAGVFVIAFAASFAGLADGLQAKGLGGTTQFLLILALAVTLFQSAIEEVFFRGWLQPALARCWGIAPAILASATAFSLLHFTSGIHSPIALANVFLGGLLFGILAAWGRGILGSVTAHSAWNSTEAHILGLFPNPGESIYGALLDFDLVGPDTLGGSQAGLNASLPLTLGLALVIVPLVLALRKSVFTDRAAARP